MGHSQLEKQKTHDRIVEVAARCLREKGLEGIGVADLMKEAGLTVGGFYKHFPSREDMVVEAMEEAFGVWDAHARAQGREPSQIPIEDFASTYLSAEHREDIAGGCPFAALTADLARAGDRVRAVATRQFGVNLDQMAARVEASDDTQARRKAVVLSCLVSGALALSRLSDDAELSDEILGTVRDFVVDYAKA